MGNSLLETRSSQISDVDALLREHFQVLNQDIEEARRKDVWSPSSWTLVDCKAVQIRQKCGTGQEVKEKKIPSLREAQYLQTDTDESNHLSSNMLFQFLPHSSPCYFPIALAQVLSHFGELYLKLDGITKCKDKKEKKLKQKIKSVLQITSISASPTSNQL